MKWFSRFRRFFFRTLKTFQKDKKNIKNYNEFSYFKSLSTTVLIFKFFLPSSIGRWRNICLEVIESRSSRSAVKSCSLVCNQIRVCRCFICIFVHKYFPKCCSQMLNDIANPWIVCQYHVEVQKMRQKCLFRWVSNWQRTWLFILNFCLFYFSKTFIYFANFLTFFCSRTEAVSGLWLASGVLAVRGMWQATESWTTCWGIFPLKVFLFNRMACSGCLRIIRKGLAK